MANSIRQDNTNPTTDTTQTMMRQRVVEQLTGSKEGVAHRTSAKVEKKLDKLVGLKRSVRKVTRRSKSSQNGNFNFVGIAG